MASRPVAQLPRLHSAPVPETIEILDSEESGAESSGSDLEATTRDAWSSSNTAQRLSREFQRSASNGSVARPRPEGQERIGSGFSPDTRNFNMPQSQRRSNMTPESTTATPMSMSPPSKSGLLLEPRTQQPFLRYSAPDQNPRTAFMKPPDNFSNLNSRGRWEACFKHLRPGNSHEFVQLFSEDIRGPSSRLPSAPHLTSQSSTESAGSVFRDETRDNTRLHTQRPGITTPQGIPRSSATFSLPSSSRATQPVLRNFTAVQPHEIPNISRPGIADLFAPPRPGIRHDYEQSKSTSLPPPFRSPPLHSDVRPRYTPNIEQSRGWQPTRAQLPVGNAMTSNTKDKRVIGQIEQPPPTTEVQVPREVTNSVPLQNTDISKPHDTSNVGADSGSELDEHVEPVPVEDGVEAVKAIAQDLAAALDQQQEMTVQSAIRQAISEMKTRPVPKMTDGGSNPFRKLFRKENISTETVHAPIGIARKFHQKRQQRRQGTISRVQEIEFNYEVDILPRYKSIGRVATSFLAPNCATAKYEPYDPEDEKIGADGDEKYMELKQRYGHNQSGLAAQRHCQELVWHWGSFAAELLDRLDLQKDDVVFYFLDLDEGGVNQRRMKRKLSSASFDAWRIERESPCAGCGGCDANSRMEQEISRLGHSPDVDDKTLALAGLAAHVFHKISGVSLWHFATGGTLAPKYASHNTEKQSSLCLLCFRNYCPTHGAFEEPTDVDVNANAYINDEEADRNMRKLVSLPKNKSEPGKSHVCGIYCVGKSASLRDILGRRSNNTISGLYRAEITQSRATFQDEDLCGSRSCFWDTRNRSIDSVRAALFPASLRWTDEQRSLFDKFMPMYLSSRRAPCQISQAIEGLKCSDVFQELVFRINAVPHGPETGGLAVTAAHPSKKKLKKEDVEFSDRWDMRPPFVPCSHTGPCGGRGCSCAKSKVHCERFCGCDENCERRYKGCTCKALGQHVCFTDNRCECRKLKRECDPSLCGSCGVAEVLESTNKFNEEIRKGKCRNNSIQLGIPAATTKAPSQVQGYGLYSKSDLAKGDYIGEYAGEIISIAEANRRGAMYHVLGQEYLFRVNTQQEVDASHNGNKMRFMNNSQKKENINVQPRTMWCSGINRVGLFASRAIKAGEELLYNYGYPDEIVKNFWEPGERPTRDRVAIPVTHTAARIARFETQSNPNHPSDSTPARGLKRKAWTPESSEVLEDQSVGEEDQGPEPTGAKDFEVDEWEDEEYASGSDGIPPSEHEHSESGDAEYQASKKGKSRPSLAATRQKPKPKNYGKSRNQRVGSKSSRLVSKLSKGVTNDGRVRKRKIFPHDRRLGGAAQAQAWETRKRNLARGVLGPKSKAAASTTKKKKK